MANYVWLNGQKVDYDEAVVHVEDRGFQFGDGLYEVARVYDGVIFGLAEHIQRMKNGAKEIELQVDWDQLDLVNVLRTLVADNGVQNGLVYWQVTRGFAPRQHVFPREALATVIAYTRAQPQDVAAREKGIKTIIQPDKRWLMCHVKSVNLLANVLAKEQARRQGATEVLLEREGVGVVEAGSSNLFMVKDGRIFTAPLSNLILPGITRGFVLKLADELRISVEQRYFTREELMNADEVFITNTSMEVTPVIEIDGQPVASGTPQPITLKLQQAYRQLVEKTTAAQ